MSSTKFRSILIFLQAALLVLVIYKRDEFLFGGSYFGSTIMVGGVGIFILGGEF